MSDGPLIVTSSELADYEEAIRNKGLDASEFELTQHSAAITQPIDRILGTVTIKYKLTEIEHTYSAGSDSSWSVDFKEDLNQGKFT